MDNYDYLFSNEVLNSTEVIKGSLTTIKLDKKNELLLKRFDELNNLFPGEINKNESIHLISSDNFGSIELLKVINSRIEFKQIYITTWSYNDEFINIIESFLNKNIKVNFFVDKSIKTRKSHLYARMAELSLNNDNLIIKMHHMLHSKVTLLTDGNLFISIEGSVNYSNNQRIENFTITESEHLFNFHKNWMSELIGK